MDLYPVNVYMSKEKFSLEQTIGVGEAKPNEG
jgi:hypothetical protein